MQTMEPGLRSCQTTNDMRNMAEDNFSIEEMDQILGRMSGDSPNNDGNLNSNNDEEPQSQQNQHKNQANQEKPEQKTQECDQLGPEDISISKQEIFFGKTPLFPGTIQELDFSISLNSKQNSQNAKEEDNNRTYILRILAVCKNPDFDSLDQYVFSVRSNKYYEYYQEVRFKIKRGERADVKVAIKVPPVKQNYTIKGAIQIMLQNLQPISIPIIAQSSIPDIVCLKTLYKQDENTELIKVPAKKGMARTPPLPFKNLSPYNLTIQVQAIGAEDYSTKPYDIVTQNFVNCQANSLFFINMQLKENLNFVEPIPQRMTIRKILLLKIKNSTSFFHFPLEVCIFEGQMVQGN